MTASLLTKEDTAWAKAGYELAFGQYAGKKEAPEEVIREAEDFELVNGLMNIGVRAGNIKMLFAKEGGGLTSYQVEEKELLYPFQDQISGGHRQTMTKEVECRCVADAGRQPACMQKQCRQS